MATIELFFDSSALISAVISDEGAARVLFLLAEAGKIIPVISFQVTVEVERSLSKKIPEAIPYYRQVLKAANFKLVKDPAVEMVKQNPTLMKHETDIPILLAAMQCKAKFLVTLNCRHFLDDPAVSRQSGLKIGTPGDALAWVRQQLFSVK